MNVKIAVITGASSGVGVQFFNAITEKCKDLDEIWLVARRADRLKELAEKSNVKTRALSLDLQDRNALREFLELVKEK